MSYLELCNTMMKEFIKNHRYLFILNLSFIMKLAIQPQNCFKLSIFMHLQQLKIYFNKHEPFSTCLHVSAMTFVEMCNVLNLYSKNFKGLCK